MKVSVHPIPYHDDVEPFECEESEVLNAPYLKQRYSGIPIEYQPDTIHTDCLYRQGYLLTKSGRVVGTVRPKV